MGSASEMVVSKYYFEINRIIIIQTFHSWLSRQKKKIVSLEGLRVARGLVVTKLLIENNFMTVLSWITDGQEYKVLAEDRVGLSLGSIHKLIEKPI